MPVFLPHKREDSAQTVYIAKYLRSQNVLCYIDALDPTLQSTDDITQTLQEKIRQCTHLMAVISEYTILSWWVPFEVGVASELSRRITSYQLMSLTALPEFLSKWPILRNNNDLTKFVFHYRQDRTISVHEGRAHIPKYSSADQFHRALKGALSQ